MPRAKGKATTLNDVAKEAGVAAMTASVVLNGARSGTRVSAATRARIEDAAARLLYRPNAVAQGLSRRRMNTIGVAAVVDNNDVNLYFLEVLNGIVAAAAQAQQNTTVLSIKDWEQDDKRLAQFCDGRVDGIILLAPTHAKPHVIEHLSRHIPFVAIHPDADSALAGVDNIDCDNEGGTYAMTCHLIGLGHARIAYFAGPLLLLGVRQRVAGYRRALAEAGLWRGEEDERLITSGVYSVSSGRDRTARLLAEQAGNQDAPTAILCANDAIAAGCLEAIANAGLRVPQDISVAGFDDLLLARTTVPPLTTVSQPFRAMGEYAVERLLQRIGAGEGAEATRAGHDAEERDPAPIPEQTSGEPEPDAPHTKIFPIRLVIRGSVASPPRRG